MSDTVVRTNNVFYGGGIIARYEVCIKRNHCHSTIFSLRTEALVLGFIALIDYFLILLNN